ncbi:hypothetical protein RMATCC62417_12043 [Rhizopus microsporus]|nr:hypothetical protein RMATCC62417_12043 [Rhizopus microsporus]
MSRDTVLGTSFSLSPKPKVDLRILLSVSSKQPDYSVGEFAKVASSTKFYEDKLKAALITKKHLYNLLADSSNKVVLPFFLAMGFELCLLTLELIMPKLHIIKEVATCQFPITKNVINDGGIQGLVKCLGKMKS